MLFDVLTGLFNALLIALSLIYPFRKKAIGRIGGLRLHCAAGCLLIPAGLIHVGSGIFDPSLSFGWAALSALILTAATGLLKRRFMKSKVCDYAHIACVCVFLLSFAVHAVQRIMDLVLT